MEIVRELSRYSIKGCPTTLGGKHCSLRTVIEQTVGTVFVVAKIYKKIMIDLK